MGENLLNDGSTKYNDTSSACGGELSDNTSECPTSQWSRIKHWVSNKLLALVERFDRPASAMQIFLALLPVLFVIVLPWVWSDNEENYFILAHRWVDPSAFSKFHAVFDHSNARFFFEYLLGSLIVHVGYESAHVIARLIMSVVFAVGFAVLFASLSLSPLRALTVLGIFCLAGQGFFGGEFIFYDVEAKTFAYAAAFAAFGLVLRGRLLPAVLLMVASTYFHFLVGGFWSLALIALALFRKQSLRSVMRVSLVYLLLTLPLVVVLGYDQLGGVKPQSGMSADEIYAKTNLFHIAPFSDLHMFSRDWATGIVAVLALIVAFAVVAGGDSGSALASLILVLLCYLILALLIAFFDRNTFLFSKLYLFRPSSLILLLVITYMLEVGMGRHPGSDLMVRRLAAVVLIAIFLWVEVRNETARYRGTSRWAPDLVQMVPIIESETSSDEIALIEPLSSPTNPGLTPEVPDVKLVRQLTRPTLVSWKFVPTYPADVLEWNDRMKFRETLFRDGCHGELKYPVKLLIVFTQAALERVSSCGPVIWSGKNSNIVRVDSRSAPRRD